MIPIAGATSADQMRDNLRAIDLVLADETVAELDSASEFDLGHPYQMVGWEMQTALGYAGMFESLDIPSYPFAR